MKISIESGKGGDGIASGRRESGVPFGGPNGGDGGNGGDIYFVASKDENTLIDYKYKKIFKAKAGEPGRTKDQYGAHGANLELVVPVGTMIKDAETGRLLAQMEHDGQKLRILAGGEGGKGNIHFKDSVNQYPNFYILGEPGHKREIVLELQLLADVGLIGTPSVGKSSLINCMADVKAKVAEYPFTTLVPNLASVSVGNFRFNVIDIPGLIEGASDGKGLGNAFLRHVLKSRVFAFVADLGRFEAGMRETIQLIDEIMLYLKQKFADEDEELNFIFREENGLICFEVEKNDEVIISKRLLFVLNKWDLINDEEVLKEYKAVFYDNINTFLKERRLAQLSLSLLEKNTFTTSAGTFYGIDNLLRKFAELLQKTESIDVELDTYQSEEDTQDEENYDLITEITEEEKPHLIEEGYIEELESRFAKVWYIQNREICKMVFTLPWGNDEAENYFWQLMQNKGFIELLEDEGMMKGDILRIRSFYEGVEDKYILY
ncbi:MAG: GTPase ObgE [candidate division SR1 bacterium]|nr:GTPase ObgE [candidate division SR1 bacterium]